MQGISRWSFAKSKIAFKDQVNSYKNMCVTADICTQLSLFTNNWPLSHALSDILSSKLQLIFFLKHYKLNIKSLLN